MIQLRTKTPALLAAFVLTMQFSTAQVKFQVPEIAGPFVHLFDPNDKRKEPADSWYTNDHTFARATDGTWHAYGIIGHHPVNPWTGETKFFHISSKTLLKEKWTDHDYAMTAQDGTERVLWAPYIFNKNGVQHMFYNIGNMQPNAPNFASWGQLALATSTDFVNWKRHDRNPLFSDPGHARDSYILFHNNTYYYYYTRTFNEVDLRSTVAVRKGPDLKTWSGPKIVHIQPYRVDWGGDAESPFVIVKDGLFYLFICRAMSEYNQTDVYWSKDPENFPIENLVTTLPVHAAEIINDKKDGWFISNTGWDKRGLFLAPLKWTTPNKK